LLAAQACTPGVVLGDHAALVGRLAHDLLCDVVGAAAGTQLDHSAVELREADDRLRELATEGAQAVGVRIDDRGLAEHVARKPGEPVPRAVHEPVGVRRTRQAELLAPRERTLDAPREQRAIDLREAVGGRREHAQLAVLGIRDGEADLVAVVVDEPHVLAGGQRGAGLDVAAAAADERHGGRGERQRLHPGLAPLTRRACADVRSRTRRAG
jgi:hypothetical protein